MQRPGMASRKGRPERAVLALDLPVPAEPTTSTSGTSSGNMTEPAPPTSNTSAAPTTAGTSAAGTSPTSAAASDSTTYTTTARPRQPLLSRVRRGVAVRLQGPSRRILQGGRRTLSKAGHVASGAAQRFSVVLTKCIRYLSKQPVGTTLNLLFFTAAGLLSNLSSLLQQRAVHDAKPGALVEKKTKHGGDMDSVLLNLQQDAAQAAPFQALRLDEADLEHARWSYEGRALFSWIKGNKTSAEQKLLGRVSVNYNSSINIEVTAMLATVDRRPRRWQLYNGCAMTSWVALSNSIIVRFNKNRPPTDKFLQPVCSVCWVWGDHLSASTFARAVKQTFGNKTRVFRPPNHRKADATVCVGGRATFSERQRWNSTNWHRERNYFYRRGFKEDARDSAHGFVWAVWCQLPSTPVGTENPLTSCKAMHPTSWDETLQAIHYTSSFQLPIKQSHGGGAYRVRSRWPWKAFLVDEHHYADPVIPPFPKGSRDLTFVWAEGPLWAKQKFESKPDDVIKFNLSEYPITLKKNVPSAIGPRFVLSMLQQATIAPDSTRFVAVLDSQARASIVGIKKLLEVKLSTWFPICTKEQQPHPTYDNSFALLYTDGCFSRPVSDTAERELTFRDLLEFRKVQLRIVPFPLKAELFGVVRQMGQTAFAAWLGLRFSAEFHTLMYMDTDGMPFVYPLHHAPEMSRSFKKVLYARLYQSRRPCANQRFDAYEYAVTKQLPRLELRCIRQALLNETEFNATRHLCSDRPGHLVARTDSLGMLWIHDNYAIAEDLPEGVRQCTWRNGLYFPPTLAAEMHLRPDAREEQGENCLCYPERLVTDGKPDW